MRLVPSLLSLIVVVACTTTTAARGTREASTRTVVVDGREQLAEDAAYALVQDAERTSDPAQKKTAYRRVVDEFADTTSAGTAAVGLARVLLDEKTAASTKEAQSVLEGFLLEDPTHPAADDARSLLAVAQMGASGGGQPAGAHVKAIVDKLPEGEQGPALLKLGRELVSRGQAKEGVVALLTALPKLSGADRKAAEDDIVFALDVPAAAGGLAFKDVRALKDEHGKDAFADEVLTWKLARVALHQKDDVGAQALAKDLVKKHPTSRFAKDANTLITRLQARVQTDANVVGVVLPL